MSCVWVFLTPLEVFERHEMQYDRERPPIDPRGGHDAYLAVDFSDCIIRVYTFTKFKI